MGGGPLVDALGPSDPTGRAPAAIATRLQAACLASRTTIALAESCTGGLVAAAITDIAGSSGYFAGGVVSYANEAKRDLLGVDPAVLDAHGAVSAQVARAMAVGARGRFGATIAASVTGIAGPDGGSPAKPVGLTYIAVADEAAVDVRRIVWTGDRAANRRDSAIAVLELLLERVAGRGEGGGGPAAAAPRPDATAGR
jgi:nicotinamide-nucleotide amidase